MNDIEKNVIEGTAEVVRRCASANVAIMRGERENAVDALRAALFYLGDTLGPLLGVDFLGLEMTNERLDAMVERLRVEGLSDWKPAKEVAP